MLKTKYFNKKLTQKPKQWSKSLTHAITLALAIGGTNMPISSWAKSLEIPDIIILGTNTNTGPSFTVPENFSETDTLSVEVSGTVDMYGGRNTVNAAGIIVAPSKTAHNYYPGQVHRVTTSNLPGQHPWGALLIGNSDLGFFPLFRMTDPIHGLNDSAPPTTLSLIDVPLSSIFNTVKEIPKGTVLEFRINEALNSNGDNRGDLTIKTIVPPLPSPCEGRATYDAISQTIELPYVDIIENKRVVSTFSVTLAQLMESTQLYNIQSVADVTVGSSTEQCHATYIMGTGELKIPFIDIPGDAMTGFPDMVYTATLVYDRNSPFAPVVPYDLMVKNLRRLEP